MAVGVWRAGVIAMIVFGLAMMPPLPNEGNHLSPSASPQHGSVTPGPRPGVRPRAAAVPRGDARILVLGLTQDNRRTDTIEVAQWDDAHRRVRLLGIPRDIDVTLAGIGTTKLAHAYATGGVGRARAVVVGLLKVPIAHYVVFSLPAMRHVVDLIGGVPIDVEKRMVYTDRLQHLVIDLYPGVQVLNGERAEEYLRFRHDAEGDIGRIRRQQHFLRAAMAQIRKPVTALRLPGIIRMARAYVQTDLTASQILDWVRRVKPLTPADVGTESIGGTPAALYDALERARLDFWVPNPDDLRAKVRWLVTGAVPGAAPSPRTGL
jgi:polyisoprenyl-teichoic acid--peptidoglycan teichoic acid transferase